METHAVRPFPWNELPAIERAAIEVRRAARATLRELVDAQLLTDALKELFDLELQGFGEIGARPIAGPPGSLGADVQLKANRARLTLSVEPALVAWIVSRAVGRPSRIDDNSKIDDALQGAWTAVIAELCRRSARTEAARPAAAADDEPIWQIDFWVRLEGSAFRGRCSMSMRPQNSQTRAWDPHSALPLRLPRVLARVPASVSQLASLSVGDALLFAEAPAQQPLSCCELCAPQSPYRVELGEREGGLVLLGIRRVDYEEAMTSEANSDDEQPTVEDAIADAPVEVRVELGSVTLSAAEWLALSPGDVVTTELPIGSHAVLRVGKKAIASGVLVNVEGQLGVKIEQLARD